MLRHGKLMEEVDKGGGGAPPPKKEEKKEEVNPLKAQLDEANAARTKAEKLLADKAAADKKTQDEKDLADGKAKEMLAAKEKELEANNARIAEFETREKKRAKAMFDKLPAPEQEIAKGLEKQLSISGYAEYLEQKIGVLGVTPPPPNANPGGGDPKTSEKGKRKLSEDGKDLLKKNYARDTAYAMSTHMEEVPLTQGETKFTMALDVFIDAMRRRARTPRELTPESIGKMFATR